MAPDPTGSSSRTFLARPLIVLLLLCILGAFAVWRSADSQPAIAAKGESHPQSRWAACNRHARSGGASTFHPLSDRAAAAVVTHQRETRPFNARGYVLNGRAYPSLNAYVPTAKQLRQFRAARLSDGRSVTQFNPYLADVDGLDGLRHPSTDDLIQWSAHKWGVPENWLRAEYVQESYWNGFQLGDETSVRPAWYRRYPSQARVPGSLHVYQSMGITQVKWIPDGSVGAGTEPLRWESTAFNLDYQAAMVRFYYDNPSRTRTSWGDGSYAPCQQWNSIGGWFSPYPWRNGGQSAYIGRVQSALSARTWTSSSFVNWRPPTPRGVRFR